MNRSKYISILECRSINKHSSKSIAGRWWITEHE
jgi:hypothetical protein